MTPDHKAKLAAELCEIVAMLSWLDPSEITPATSLTAVDIDSLGRIELIAHVEAHLGSMISEEAIPRLDTVAEIVEFAEKMETRLLGSAS